MLRAGVSLRPVVFFAVFFGIIWIPSFLGQLVDMLYGPAGQANLRESAVRGQDHFEDPAAVFGPDVERTLIRPARDLFAPAFAKAEIAEWTAFPTGESAFVARFPDPATAYEAQTILAQQTGIANTTGSTETGFFGTRPGPGDAAFLRTLGRAVLYFTGPSRAAIEKRLAGAQLVDEAAAARRPAWLQVLDSLTVKVVGVLLLAGLASFWFFRGSAWAARADGQGAPRSASEVAARLEQVRTAIPVTVTRQGDVFRFEWDEHDPRWRAHADLSNGLRAFRLEVRLDPSAHAARPTEYWRELKNRVDNQEMWIRGQGALLYSYSETASVDQAGNWSVSKFNLDELRRPVIHAVTSAGWSWRPSVWNLPPWLSWLEG
jgi:hypothetical protein